MTTVSRAIQIRDVPDDVHATMRTRAAARGMSLSDFLRNELEVLARQQTLEEVFARAELRSGAVGIDDLVKAVRETRDT